MVDGQDFVAVGLLTQRDLDLLGEGFMRAYPLMPDTNFDDLLTAIDRAEHRHLR